MELDCRRVLRAASVPEALGLLRAYRPDAAILDINLKNVLVYPVAEHLAAAYIPFIFATGYGRGGIGTRWKDIPVIHKPFELTALAATLGSILSG